MLGLFLYLSFIHTETKQKLANNYSDILEQMYIWIDAWKGGW